MAGGTGSTQEEKTMSNINDSLARMRAVAGTLNIRQTQETGQLRRRHVTEIDTDTQMDDEALDITVMKNNAVYQIMNKTSLAGDEQIAAIAKYLTVENDDYASARKRFAEFQAYFNHVQSEGMKLDMKGLERLIEEVQSALKPEVEKIVNDVIAVQKGVDESKKLLEVMRAARLEGKSIEQIKQAMDINDQVLKEIKALSDMLAQLHQTEEYRKTALNERLDAKLTSEKGFWNGIVRSFRGPDKKIAAAIEDAQQRLQGVQSDIETSNKDLQTKQTERNTNLESGPLVILRSIDATDNGFAENIVATANNSLDLIRGASTSVQRLLKRMAYSKSQAMSISDSIARAEVREAILEGAVQRVSKISHDQSENIKQRLTAQDDKLGATEDMVEKAALNAERVSIAELQKTALAYEEDIKRTHANFAMTTANSVEAQSRAGGFYNLLLAQEDMLQQVAARTLPETARALRMGLEVNVGMQTTELASSISAVTRRAIEIGKQSYVDLATTQDELRAADLKIMQDAIDALTAAQDSVVNAAEATVKHSGERGNLTGSLSKATSGLRELLEQFDDIRTRAADPLPSTAAADAEDIGGPARPPKAPANDAGTPAPVTKVAGGPG
jgi:hypothetical protein